MRLHLSRDSGTAIRYYFLGILLGTSWIVTATSVRAQEPLAQRIAHTDLHKFEASSSHGGAGTRINQQLMDSKTLGVNLNFLIRGRLQPGGGIGHHFHNSCEEMLFILDGEAEFTVDGRTALIKGPGGPLPYGALARALQSDRQTSGVSQHQRWCLQRAM